MSHCLTPLQHLMSLYPRRLGSSADTRKTYSPISQTTCLCGCILTSLVSLFLHSVLWRCWLGGRKGIRPVKTEWWGAGMVICLELVADLHIAQLMPLPLTVSCFSEIQIGLPFLVPTHLGSPGKRAVKRVCVSKSLHFPQPITSLLHQCQEDSSTVLCCLHQPVFNGFDRETETW